MYLRQFPTTCSHLNAQQSWGRARLEVSREFNLAPMQVTGTAVTTVPQGAYEQEVEGEHQPRHF